jgi:hypothetical protein
VQSDAEQIGKAQATCVPGQCTLQFFCAVIPNIALSLPVKTLTLPAIETAEGTEHLTHEDCEPASKHKERGQKTA